MCILLDTMTTMRNITSDCMQEMMNSGIRTSQCLKIMKSFRLLLQKKIELTYKYEDINLSHTISLFLNNVEIGYFIIGRNENTYTLNISVEDEFQNMGFSRLMVAAMILYLNAETNLNIRYDQLLFIDTDASWRDGKSFWDSIGMTECRFYKLERDAIRANTKIDGVGYEKQITYTDLSKWALGVPCR